MGPKLDKDPRKRIPTRSRLASAGLVRHYPRAEVNPGYLVIQLGYHLPVAIRTSLWISHLIKMNKSEQAVTKGTRCVSTPRCNSKPAGMIVCGVAPPLESPRFTPNWRDLEGVDTCHLCGSQLRIQSTQGTSVNAQHWPCPRDFPPGLQSRFGHAQPSLAVARPMHAPVPLARCLPRETRTRRLLR